MLVTPFMKCVAHCSCSEYCRRNFDAHLNHRMTCRPPMDNSVPSTFADKCGTNVPNLEEMESMVTGWDLNQEPRFEVCATAPRTALLRAQLILRPLLMLSSTNHKISPSLLHITQLYSNQAIYPGELNRPQGTTSAFLRFWPG